MADKKIETNDIIFECPHCGKSLAIDPRGAGMTIPCPDCKNQVQVPASEDDSSLAADTKTDTEVDLDIDALADALDASQSRVQDLVENLTEVTRRRSYLEDLRADNLSRFEQIGKELTTIQAAMDRIVDTLQGARNGGQ